MPHPECNQDLESVCVDLASSIRKAVYPNLGNPLMRRHAGKASSGDQSFSYDELAEQVLVRSIQASGRSVAVLSEGAGLKAYGDGQPSFTLIVDPIDGTRPACLGLEMSCVSVAALRYCSEPTFADVIASAVVRIKEGTCFSASRGLGSRRDGKPLVCERTSPVPIEALFWSTEVVGRPAASLFARLTQLIEATSVKGGMFIWNSTTYSMTAIATGALDAYVDVPLEQGEVGLFAYDVAAAYLVLLEAGGLCTTQEGQDIARTVLFMKDGHLPMLRVVAARNKEIHDFVLAQLAPTR